MFRTIGVLQVLWFVAAMCAAQSAVAGIQPEPFLKFQHVPNSESAAHFEVSVPSDPIVPVEVLTLSLTGTDPALEVELAGMTGGAFSGPADSAAIVDFSHVGTTPPDDTLSVDFDLMVDFAPFMGSMPVSGIDPQPFLIDPVSGVDPQPFLKGPLSAFNAMFDVLVDDVVVHHVMRFEAEPQFLFSDVAIDSGSVLLGFSLAGDYENAGPELFRVTITGSAETIPEPTTALLTMLGLLTALPRRRTRATN